MCGPGPTVAWKGKASRHSDRDASPFPMDLYPGIGFPMSRLEHLENEVRTLSLEELKAWFDEQGWETGRRSASVPAPILDSPRADSSAPEEVPVGQARSLRGALSPAWRAGSPTTLTAAHRYASATPNNSSNNGDCGYGCPGYRRNPSA